MRKTAISDRRLMGVPRFAVFGLFSYFKVPRYHGSGGLEKSKPLRQGADHPSRRPPDEILAVGHGKVIPQSPAVMQRMPLMVRRIEQEGQGHLENFGHLKGIRLQVERRCYQSHHRRYPKTRSRSVFGQKTNDLHTLPRQPNFLLGFAQSRIHRCRIVRLDPPAGKADLPGMIPQMCRPLGKQHRVPTIAQDNRKQHRRRRQGLIEGTILLNEMPGRRLGQQTGPQTLQIDRHRAGASSSISALTEASASCNVSSDKSLIDVATRSADSTAPTGRRLLSRLAISTAAEPATRNSAWRSPIISSISRRNKAISWSRCGIFLS